MTREECLELLKQIEKDIHVCNHVSTLLEDAKSCAIHSAIEELKQEPRWIPTSEELPKVNEEAYSDAVLISVNKIVKDYKYQVTKIACYDMNAISSDGIYMDTEGWVLENGSTLSMDEVIAWMPLPEPYKAEESEE